MKFGVDSCAAHTEEDSVMKMFGLNEGVLGSNSFGLEIDYQKTVEQMILGGGYDRTDERIVETFNIDGEGVVKLIEACLVRFEHNIGIEKIEKYIRSMDKQNPWSSAKIEHLLSFGARFPDEQRISMTIGLGSSVEVDGKILVPGLGKSRFGRCLNLVCRDDAFWFATTGSFLVVRDLKELRMRTHLRYGRKSKTGGEVACFLF